MGLLELIKNIGEKNISVQCINNCYVSAKDKKTQRNTEITILTEEVSTNDLFMNKGKVGLIVWIDREDAVKNGI